MDLVDIPRLDSASSFVKQEIPKLFFLERGKHFDV
jgi:hypothetical protein